MAAEHVLEHRRRALVGDVFHLQFQFGLEHFADDVANRAAAAGAEWHRLALRLHVVDELRHVLDRNRGGNEERIGRGAKHGHVGKVLHRVIGRLVKQKRRNRNRRAVGDEQGVRAVVGVDHRVGADGGAAAGAVVHQHWLLEPLAQGLGDQAANDVAGASRWKRHHQFERPVRPVLRRRVQRHCPKNQSQSGFGDDCQFFHDAQAPRLSVKIVQHVNPVSGQRMRLRLPLQAPGR